ncbi:UPF0158 family protein [Zunongwangia atlantica]
MVPPSWITYTTQIKDFFVILKCCNKFVGFNSIFETNKLIQILQQRHPFRHFKHTVDHSEFRQDWFAFKQQFIEKLITETFQMHTSSEE